MHGSCAGAYPVIVSEELFFFWEGRDAINVPKALRLWAETIDLDPKLMPFVVFGKGSLWQDLLSLGTRVKCDKWLCILETWKGLQAKCCVRAKTPPCKVYKSVSVKRRTDLNTFNPNNNLSVWQNWINSATVDFISFKWLMGNCKMLENKNKNANSHFRNIAQNNRKVPFKSPCWSIHQIYGTWRNCQCPDVKSQCDVTLLFKTGALLFN